MKELRLGQDVIVTPRDGVLYFMEPCSAGCSSWDILDREEVQKLIDYLENYLEETGDR